MSGELSLFGHEPTEQPVQPVATGAPIADWLVDAIRTALAAKGLITMAERQHAIEAAVGRPVESLRSLTRAEAMRVLSLFGSTPERKNEASAWDDREEDTWIDRL